jgi:DNA modification methylase
MTLHFSDAWLDIHQGDVRDVLPSLASDSVDCIVTSPPYWGLRDYGTAAWDGGDAECDHLVGPPASSSNTLNGGKGWTPTAYGIPHKGNCGKCGAIRQDSQLGLERTPEEYVANLVAVFRELRRVLKPSGTCWLNLGDSYAHNTEAHPTQRGTDPKMATSARARVVEPTGVAKARGAGLKPKDLVGIPWRVAFALQADGWYLRSDIIWAKPNPMPESVTDRPTKAHEYLFLLTKSARYYFDADAVREGFSPSSTPQAPDVERGASPSTWAAAHLSTPQRLGNGSSGMQNAGRNLRSVWTIATRPYPGAHFAVFPPELPERCIKAGSSERGVCPECGAPWERVVSVGGASPRDLLHERGAMDKSAVVAGRDGSLGSRQGIQHAGGHGNGLRPRETKDWVPTCLHHYRPDLCQCGVADMFGDIYQSHRDDCPAGDDTPSPHPAVILDPFAGSGTVGMVANRLSRRAILIDLNADYLKQQLQRNAQTPLGLGA